MPTRPDREFHRQAPAEVEPAVIPPASVASVAGVVQHSEERIVFDDTRSALLQALDMLEKALHTAEQVAAEMRQQLNTTVQR